MTFRTATRLFCYLAMLACLSGCAVSVHPLHTNDVLVSEPSLAGTWEAVADGDGRRKNTSLTFRKCENENGEAMPGSYDLEMVRGKEVSLWKAHLVKLGDDLYLDMCPSKVVVKPQTHREFMLPLHMICRLTVAQDKLTIQYRHDMAVCFVPSRRSRLLTFAEENRLSLRQQPVKCSSSTGSTGRTSSYSPRFSNENGTPRRSLRRGAIAPMPTSAT